MNIPLDSPDTALRLTRVFNAPRERVFAAWTRPELLRQWFGCNESVIRSAEVDVRPGGRFDLLVTVGELSCRTFGTYREVVVPSRLVFTYGWEGKGIPDIGETLVTIDLTDLEGTRTRMDFVHDGFPDASFKENLRGWPEGFAKLDALLAA